MKRNTVLGTAQFLLIILGIVMILIGAIFSTKFLLPPIITGIGFIIIAWAFKSMKR